MSEINLSALKDRIDELYDWKKGSQALELERAENRGSQREAVENLKLSVHALFDAVNHIKDARDTHVKEDGRRKIKVVGWVGVVIGLIELVKMLIAWWASM